MKLLSIQILRGGAAWLVVVHHFMQQFYSFQPTNLIGDFFSNYGHFGVDIFFVISGFIMAYILSNSDKSAKDFFINRLIRIIPNYWFWTMVIVILGFFINEFHSSEATIQTIIMSLFFIPHENPSELLGVYPTLTVGWTLNLEMYFYFLLSIILLFKLSSNSNILIIVGLLLLLPIFYKLVDIEVYKNVAGNLRLFEFAVGIILYYIKDKYCSFFESTSMIIFFFLSLLIVWFNINNMFYILCAGFIVYLILRMNSLISNNKTNIFINFFIYLGEISFSTYLVHAITLPIIYYGFIGEVNNIFLFVIYILSTLFISIISYKTIEIRLSKKLKVKYAS